MDPENAIILQNKDQVLIPLLQDELPTAKEFKDNLASLSPEQKRFANAFREMQLSSSVFGVCVIQLKPQLEDILHLPQGALTKEIQLTQDLLTLFIDYQIPPDLLAYDGPEDTDRGTKVNMVKDCIQSVLGAVERLEATKREEQRQDLNQILRDYQDPGEIERYPGASDMLQYWNSNLRAEIEDVHRLLREMPTTVIGVDILDRVEKRLRASHGTERITKMESRLLADACHRKEAENRLQRMDQHLRSLQDAVKALRAAHEREGGFLHAHTQKNGAFVMDGGSIAGQQNKLQGSLGNKALIAASKEVGMATLEELERQRSVLNNIEKEIYRIDGAGSISAFAPARTLMRKLLTNSTSAHRARLDQLYTEIDGAANTTKGTERVQTFCQDLTAESAGAFDYRKEGPVERQQRLPQSKGNTAMQEPISSATSMAETVDFTNIPKQLDAKFEQHDSDNALHVTTIKTGDVWIRSHQKNLLSPTETKSMSSADIKTEKDKAFDLLDSLSRSGSLPLAYSEVHVVVAATHRFENDVVGTVVQDNIDPIEKVKQSSLLVASAIHSVPVDALIQ